MCLALYFSKCLGQMEELCLSWAHPGGEVPHLPVIAVIGEPHLWSLLAY